jgi:hypothetical protein
MVVDVEAYVILSRAASHKFGRAETPEFAYTQARDDALSRIPLEGFGVNLNQSRSVLTIDKRLEKCGRMRGIEHRSHAPETTMDGVRTCVNPTGRGRFPVHRYGK